MHQLHQVVVPVATHIVMEDAKVHATTVVRAHVILGVTAIVRGPADKFIGPQYILIYIKKYSDVLRVYTFYNHEGKN